MPIMQWPRYISDQRRCSTFQFNVRWQVIGSMGQAVLSGLVLLLLGREFGAERFGIYSIIIGYVYLFNSLIEPRMQDVAAKQLWGLEDHADTKERPFRTSQIADFLVFEAVVKLLPVVALMVASSVLVSFGRLPAGGESLIVVAAVWVYFGKLGSGLATGTLRVLGRSDINALCANLELCLRLLFTWIAIQFSMLSVALALSILGVAAVIGNGLLWWFLVQRVDVFREAFMHWSPRNAWHRTRGVHRLVASNFFLSLTDLMNKDLDVTLTSSLMSAEQVGLYKMAKSIAQLTWRAIDPFYLALMPELSRLVATHRVAETKRLLFRISGGLFALAAFLGMATAAGFSLFGGTILGHHFDHIAPSLHLMLFAIAMAAPWVWGHPLAVALNRAEYAVVASLGGSVAGLVAMLILVPRFSAQGASIAWAGSLLITLAITAALSRYRLGVCTVTSI